MKAFYEDNEDIMGDENARYDYFKDSSFMNEDSAESEMHSGNFQDEDLGHAAQHNGNAKQGSEHEQLERMESEMDRIKARLKMYEDPPPPAAMDVRVDGYAWHGSALAKHCRYRIRRTWEGQSLSVYRRFSDFVLLYEKLVREFPGAVVPNHPEKKMTYTNPLGGSDVLAAERVQWFQAFLQGLVQHPRLSTSIWLRDFLQLATEDWQTRCEEDANNTGDNGAVANGSSKAGSEASTPSMLEASAQASLHQLQQYAPDVSSIKSFVTGWSTSVASSIANLSSRARSNSQDSGTSTTPASSAPASPATMPSYPFVEDDSTMDENSKGRGHTVDSQYVRLCWADSPLQINTDPLSQSVSSTPTTQPKKIQIKIEARNARVQTMTRLARACLNHLQCSGEVGACMTDLSKAAEALSEAEGALAPGSAKVMDALASGLENLADSLTSESATGRITKAIEPVLEYALIMQGANRAYENLLRDRRQRNSVVDAPFGRSEDADLAEKEDALADDLQSHSENLCSRLAGAMEALAEAEIAQARENQLALRKFLLALQEADPETDWENATKASRQNAGIGVTQEEPKQYLWDTNTPM